MMLQMTVVETEKVWMRLFHVRLFCTVQYVGSSSAVQTSNDFHAEARAIVVLIRVSPTVYVAKVWWLTNLSNQRRFA